MTGCDGVVIGCGPAGLSAALFCGRANMRTVLIGKKEKSQLFLAKHIENYFGFPDGIDGPELLALGIRQAERFGVTVVAEEAVSAKKEGKGFMVKTDAGQAFTARALLIATGLPIRMSGIKNEAALIGKGIHYCASCDGPLYNRKRLAVIGNGNHAAETAAELFPYTKDITIISNASGFSLSKPYREEIGQKGVQLVDRKLKEFAGAKWLEGILDAEGSLLRFDGVFMACGTASALDFASELGIRIENNLIVTDENGMTAAEGVFATGNGSGKSRQVAKNVGDGCNAAVSVIKFLSSRALYMDYTKGRE